MSNEPNIVIDIVETDIGEIYGYCPECEVNKGRHASMVSPLWSFCPFCGSEITFPKPIMDDYKVIKCDWCGNDIAKKYSYEINSGEKICEDCVNHSTTCDRCEKVIHEDEECDGLCECCYDDMHG